jgi:hypothetical protein
VKKLMLALLAGAVASLAVVALAAGAARTTHKIAAAMSTSAAVPKPKGATHARGSFTGTYVTTKSGATLKWKLSFSGLTGPALQAHIHLGKKGVAGNVIVPLCAPCHNGQRGTAKLTKSVVKALVAGKTYANVHTKKNPAGEIRGQIKVS